MTRECTCSFAQRLQGDGFEACNPEKVIDILREQLAASQQRVKELEFTTVNIRVHLDRLCTHELRQHGFVSPDHDIDFQVFRVLCGYKELMDSHKALEDALKDISGQMTTKELASACVCDPDIEFGYDEIIRAAREALEATCQK